MNYLEADLSLFGEPEGDFTYENRSSNCESMLSDSSLESLGDDPECYIYNSKVIIIPGDNSTV